MPTVITESPSRSPPAAARSWGNTVSITGGRNGTSDSSTVTGVALGAYLYEELRGYLLTSETFANFQLVVAGVLLLLIVLFFPAGLMGWIYARFPRTQKVLE